MSSNLSFNMTFETDVNTHGVIHCCDIRWFHALNQNLSRIKKDACERKVY